MRRIALALAATLAAAALPPARPAAAQAMRIPFTRDSLPNGLQVIYSVDRSTPVVAVDIWYRVGSKMERPGRTGFAHLFEHVMFKGSKHVADGQHFALLEGAGARAGADINGTTSFDRTNYFEQVPSNQLELALWLEADRMGTLTQVLTKEKLDNQREVVKNERRQGVDNQPYGVWLERMLPNVFPAPHPYHHTVIGSMDDLTAASVEDVRDFFRTYYAPNNAVLVVAGDFDPAQARALVRKHFAAIPRQPAPPPLMSTALPARIGAEKRETIQDRNAPVPAIFTAYRMPPASDRRGETVNVLSTLLSARSGALFNRIVREQGLATGVGAFNFGLIDGADLMVVQSMGKPTTSPDSLEAALRRELDVVGGTIDAEAVERAKAQLRFGFINGLQTTGGFGGRADLFAQAWTYYRDPERVNRRLAEIDRVTLADVKALIAERLVPENRVVLTFVPNRATAQPIVP
jgi:zinc protease